MRPEDFTETERLLLQGAVTSRIRELGAFQETCWASSDALRSALTQETERLRGLHAMLGKKEGGRP